MPIMPFEGLQSEALEDVVTITESEPTHTEEEEAEYLDMLGGWDEDETRTEPIPGHFHYMDAAYWA